MRLFVSYTDTTRHPSEAAKQDVRDLCKSRTARLPVLMRGTILTFVQGCKTRLAL